MIDKKLYVPSSEKNGDTFKYGMSPNFEQAKKGITGKLHVLILDRRNSINRIVLFDETISTKGLIKSILPDIGKYGESIIIASNGAKRIRYPIT